MNPRKKRYCRRLDDNRIFTPHGISSSKLQHQHLSLDEFEALRLVDYEEKNQIEASEAMQVSRGTLQRLLVEARRKMVDSILHNNAIVITNDISNIMLKGENSMHVETHELLKIAFPTDDKVTVSSDFLKSEYYAIYTVQDNEIIAVHHITKTNRSANVATLLAEYDCNIVLTQTMKDSLIQQLDRVGIDVILGAKGRIDVNVNEYLGTFLSDKNATCIPVHKIG